MWKTLLATLLALAVLSGSAGAQVPGQTPTGSGSGTAIDPQMVLDRMANPLAIENCFGCEFGLYDDLALTQKTGTITPGVPKFIYLGVKFSPPYTELTGIEFSVAGMEGLLVLSVEGVAVPGPAIILGTVPAPADTSSTSTDTGGMNIAWAECQTGGDQALVRIQVLALSPITQRLLEVKRRYPPTNVDWNTPIFTKCDNPEFTVTRVSGSCFGLNWTGPLPCEGPANNPPVCDAGGPYSSACEGAVTTIALDATGSSDPDGDPLTYQWTTTCSGATFDDPTSATPTLSIPTPPGTPVNCAVELTVNDGTASSSCNANVTVEACAVNNPPVCDAGGPYSQPCEGAVTTIVLDATGSSDPDGDPLTYQWTTTCAGATFDNPASPTPTLSIPTPVGVTVDCSVGLTVNDGTESSACNATVHVDPCSAQNNPPVCDAGGPYSQACEGEVTTIVLDATGSTDPDGDPLTYQWTTTCSGATFDNPASPTPTLTIPTPVGVTVDCSVSLTVNDGTESSSCNATVHVDPCSAGNNPPVCDAGGPYSQACEGEVTTIVLDATGSSDPDGDPLTYQWTTTCSGATIDNPASPTPTLTIPTPVGVTVNCSVGLTVNDGTESSSCNATVHVDPCSPQNNPPLCDAGGPYSQPCEGAVTTIVLDATGSSDPDGDPLTYQWTTTCSGATIDNPTSPTPTLTIPTPPGVTVNCNVELTVNDGDLNSVCNATVHVDPCSGQNNPPVCDAGGPYTATCQATTTTIQLDGTGSFDPDTGDVLDYLWTSNCPGARFDDATSPTARLTLDTPCCDASCNVTLTVSDGQAETSCGTTVTVTGGTPPPAQTLVLWPPNHKYWTIEPTQCVQDVCDGGSPPVSIVVLSARSDEREDAKGTGDGNTLQDIAFSCPGTVRLRAERNGSGNGRVYTIVYLVTDASGLERQVECKVSVPKDKPGPPAVEGPGPGYSVDSECNSPLAKRSPGAASGEEIPELLEARYESLRLVRDPERGIGVEFSLENQSPVTIDVFDIAGRRVQTLRAVQPAGAVTVYWDGRDLSGRTAATGIYFFRVQAAGLTSSGKALWTR